VNTKQTLLSVDGLSCPSCIEHVRDALAIDGVTSVDVQMRDGTVAVTHDPTVAPGRIIAALATAGYEAREDRVTTPVKPARGCCG